MATTLKITDGTTNVVIDIDNTGSNGFKLLYDGGWAPNVSVRNSSWMGDDYLPVEEQLTLQISGASSTATMSNLATLSQLLNQANAWASGQGVAAVKIQYTPEGSSTAVEAVILQAERPELPPDFNRVGIARKAGTFYIMPVIVRFVRRGLWLSTVTTTTGSSTSSGNPCILTATTLGTTPDILSPYDALITFDANTQLVAVDSASEPNLYLAFTNSANKLVLIEGEDGTTDGNGASTAVTNTSGGNVHRWTSQASGYVSFNKTNFSSFDTSIRAVYVIAVIDTNNTVCNVWTGLGRDYGTADGIYTGKSAKVPTSKIANPQTVMVGPLTFDQALSNFWLHFFWETADSSSITVDLDYLGVIGADENLHIVHDPLKRQTFAGTLLNSRYYHINHRLNSHIAPYVYTTTDGATANQRAINFEGNARLTATGNSINCMVIGVDNDEYRIGTGSTAVTAALTVTHTHAYLTPR